MVTTLYWHDYESFGADPRRDRAVQFAGQRTTEELEPVGEPLVIYCRPADDFLPSPQSCLITGITPQLALECGLCEAEFIRLILEQFCQPGTCGVGYNSIRFDDELTRQLAYRNFHDPYEREWKNGNSRWDIIDMLRLCAATRPDGIAWPLNEDGNISFRLQHLASANNIDHENAHDALSDVQATIGLAALVRRQQPRLYEYVFGLRNKKRVESQLDVASRRPVLHVSSRYPSSQRCLALVAPVCRHPEDSNGVIVCDLRQDPSSWLGLPAEEIQSRLFTRHDQLPPGIAPIPLKVIHVNRCPIVAPAAALEQATALRFGIDPQAVQRHWKILQDQPDLNDKLRKAFQRPAGIAEQDPDYMIYSGGFFREEDRRFMALVRSSSPEQLAKLDIPFRDGRLAELLLRYRARNFPSTLDQEERQRWLQFRRRRLDLSARSAFDNELAAARSESTGPGQLQVLAALEDHVRALLAGLDD